MSRAERFDAVVLGWRTRLALAAVSVLGLVGFGWPFLLHHSGSLEGHEADAPFLVAGLLALLVALVLAQVGDGGLDAKALAVLAVLAAAGSVLRLLEAGVAVTEGLVFFLLVPAGRVLGRAAGFLLGALTLLASALLTAGVGPWLPFQVLALGWFGYGAGLLPRRLTGRAEVAALAAYAAVGAVLYGALMNLYFWPFRLGPDAGVGAFRPGASLAHNAAQYAVFYGATSAGWDLARALGVAALVLASGRPLLAALRRTARRAAFATAGAAPGGAAPAPAALPAPAPA